MTRRLWALVPIMALTGCIGELATPPLREVVRGYALEQVLEDHFLLVRDPPPMKREGGDLVQGKVLDIGFDTRTIVVRVRADVGGDLVWWIVHTESRKPEGPLSQEVYLARVRAEPALQAIRIEPVADVWKRLTE